MVVFNPGVLNSNIVSPADPTDPDVGILVVKGKKWQQAIGGLTIFAMHCDTIGGTQYSADYPYYIEQTLRTAFTQSYISAFGAGTCGDINHIDVSKKQNYSGFDVSEHIGSTIGDTIIRDLPNLKPLTQPSLDSRSETLTLPLQTVTPEEIEEAKSNMSNAGTIRTFDFTAKVQTVKVTGTSRDAVCHDLRPMEIQVFRLDADTAIVLPARRNFLSSLAWPSKKPRPSSALSSFSICNDRPAYMPTGEGL